MVARELSVESPFALRLIAYFNERFPAWQILGQVPLFLAAFFVGQASTGRSLRIGGDTAVGFAAFVAFTLLARALDDNKDVEHDNAHYPRRVLQRGLITLRHLRILGLLCFLLSLAGSIVIDRGIGLVTMWWFISVVTNGVYQFSMIRSRAMRVWLEERRVLFALTHLPFWGLGAVWIAQQGAGAQRLPWSVGWLVAVWIVGPLMLEIVRKTRTPEDQRPTVVDYAKPRQSWAHSLGLHGSVVVVAALGAITALLELQVLRAAGYGSLTAYAAIVGIFVVLVTPVTMRFLIAPSRSRVKDVGEFSAAAMILGQTVLVVAMLLG
jgi:4-hydroxybenzoate polyprenyltransferase